MSFTAGIPADGQSLGSSKPQVRGNFTNYNNVISADHAPPNDTNQGLHNRVTLLSQGSPPVAVATGNILFTQPVTYPNAVGTFKEVFMQRATGDGSALIQMTTKPGNPIASTNGCTFLPGGLMMQWGTGTAVQAGTAVTFPSAFPTQCYNVTIGYNNAFGTTTHSVSSGNLARTGFDAFSDTGNRGFYYIAIGN